MNSVRSLVVSLGLMTTSLTALAQQYTIGNSIEDNIAFGFHGQTFSPSVAGDWASGSAPATGSTVLLTFGIGYEGDEPVNSGTLYLFDRRFFGSVEQLAGLVVGSEIGSNVGFLGRSQSVSNGVYQFGTGLTLPDVNAVYYAYSDVETTYKVRTLEETGPDYGGTDLQRVVAFNSFEAFQPGGFEAEDLVFRADFTAVPAPAALMVVLLGGLPGGCLLSRRKS